MRTSPSIRRADRAAATCVAALLAATASYADPPFLPFGFVPDANPPTASALGVPCVQDFSAPTAAANLLGFLDTMNGPSGGHWNAEGVTAGLALPVVAEHLSWFMATNSRRDSACASGAVDSWGRTNARTGATPGTHRADLVPGLVEYMRWDAGLNPFPGPVPRPPVPPGKNGYDWRPQTFFNPDDHPADVGFVSDYGWHLYFHPLLVTFRHWHLSFLCAEGGVEYYDWLPSVSGTDDPAYAPSYSGGGTPPAEHWNDDNLGHAALGVGYHMNHQPSCTAVPRDWLIVHDGIPNTGENVAVPAFYDEPQGLSWMTSFAVAPEIAIDPDLAVDASGNRHVVWERGVVFSPAPEINYEGNAAPGAPLEGTPIPFAWGFDPAIAIDPNTGHLAVAFSSGWEIEVTTNSLGYWNEEQVSGSALRPRDPSIAIDSESNTHVVWREGCDESDPCSSGYIDTRLYWNDKPAGGSWGEAQPVFDPSGPPPASPHLDPDLAVHGTRAYLVYDYGHGEIQLLEGDISDGAITWDFDSLHAVNTSTGHPVRAPKIAVDGNGDVYVVWSDQRSGIWQTYHQARRAGSWLAADLAFSSSPTVATGPDLALRSAPNGTYVDVVWEEEQPAGNYEIVSATLFAAAGGELAYPGAVANRSATAAPSRSPAVAYNAALGTIDIAWADESVVLLPEVGFAGLLAGIAALAGVRRSHRG